MCFTVNVNIVKEEMESRYGRDFIDHEKYRPSYYYHAFSLPELPVVKAGSIELMRWGLIPSWVRDMTHASEVRMKTFNARSETLDSKPSFIESYQSKRCVIPVSGFYEWQQAGLNKIPWYIKSASDTILSLAGLWNDWTNNVTGEVIATFTIVTTEANEKMASIHNTARRMPLVLEGEAAGRWLSESTGNDELKSIARPCRSDYLDAWTIGPLISSRKADRNTPDILKPYSYPVSGTLFD
ncbi:MAG: SOS response-associated peptidase [Bacteroidales bacterium]|nr:SOS response-associated peptidase [Bacteroidales bacterium]